MRKKINRMVSIFSILMFLISNLSIINVNATNNVKFRNIVGNYDMNYAITEDGCLYEYDEQTGKYIKNDNINNVDSVVGEYSNAFIVKKDGTLWARGDNRNNQISSEDISYYEDFIKIKFINDVKQVSRFDISYALKNDGTVWGWGDLQSSDKPVKIENLNDIVTIFAGYEKNYALDKHGRIYTWLNRDEDEYKGFNPSIPKVLEGIPKILKIQGFGSKIFAFGEDNNIYTNEDIYSSSELTIDESFPKNLESIFYYQEMTMTACIVKDKNGKFYGKGDNFDGEMLADNPIVIKEFKELKQLEGYKMTLANTGIDSDGNIKTWKAKSPYVNDYTKEIELDKINNIKKAISYSYQDGRIRRSVPSGIIFTNDNQLFGYGQQFPAEYPYNFTNIGEAVGIYNIKDIDIRKEPYAYGDIYHIYVIDSSNRYYEIQTRYNDNWESELYKRELTNVNNPIKFHVNSQGLVALNYNGELIHNTQDSENVIDTGVRDYEHLEYGNILYINSYGKLVKRSVWSEDSSIVFDNSQELEKIMAVDGSYAYLLSKDGKLISKCLNQGAGNSLGQLGNGNTEGTDEFVEVKNINKKVKTVQALDDTVHALLEDGTVMAWGSNSRSALGLDTNAQYISTPQKVTGLPAIKEIKVIGERYYDKFYMAITTDGKPYYWKSDYWSDITSNIPQKIGDINNIKEINNNRLLTEDKIVYDLNDMINGYSDSPIKLPISNVIDIESEYYQKEDNKHYGFLDGNYTTKYLSSECIVKIPYDLKIEGVEIGDGTDYDVNNDGVINIYDISEVALGYNSKEGDALYKKSRDLNNDKFIDVYDLTLLSSKL